MSTLRVAVKLAFCLYKYFPFGGLQRDFLRIAQECLRRGHTVEVFTMKWEGEKDPNLSVTLIPVKAKQNHTRAQEFVEKLKPYLTAGQFDCVIGFNKMPGLDIYYAADVCYEAKVNKKWNFFYRFLPRYRHYSDYEKAVFSPESHTKILYLAEKQKQEFRYFYGTQEERFVLLPPGIAKDRIAPPNAQYIREKMRELGRFEDDDIFLLFVGSGFRTKGLNWIIHALYFLPPKLKNKTRLLVIGKDRTFYFQWLIRQLRLVGRVTFLGGREDVPNFLLAADLLIHPAYHENTGTVLLEALASGLPVITTDVCGYAHYVKSANAGVVLPSPYDHAQFEKVLEDAMFSLPNENWRANALAFAKEADIYSLPTHAVDAIETFSKSTMIDWKTLPGKLYRNIAGRSTKEVIVQNQHYFVKQHNGVGWKEIFKNLLQLRLPVLSAKNEWQALLKLKEAGLPAPEPIAFHCDGVNPAQLSSYVVMRALPETMSLEDIGNNWKCEKPSPADKFSLIKKAADTANRMHALGINHRDFYICHLLLHASSDTLYLLDLHRAQCRNKVPKRYLIRDLAALYFSSKDIGLSQRDLYRFIKQYRCKSLRDSFLKEKSFWLKVKKRGDQLFQKLA